MNTPEREDGRTCHWNDRSGKVDLASARRAIRCAAQAGCGECSRCGDFSLMFFFCDAQTRIASISNSLSAFKNPLLQRPEPASRHRRRDAS